MTSEALLICVTYMASGVCQHPGSEIYRLAFAPGSER